MERNIPAEFKKFFLNGDLIMLLLLLSIPKFPINRKK